jgi:hypothetical protein
MLTENKIMKRQKKYLAACICMVLSPYTRSAKNIPLLLLQGNRIFANSNFLLPLKSYFGREMNEYGSNLSQQTHGGARGPKV